MEIWHSRTPMMRKRTLRNGRPTTATVRFLLIGSDSDGGATWAEVKGELEVEVPGGAPATLRGIFNGNKKMAPYATPGTRLPVALHADDDQKLAIDWDRWDDEGGLAAAKARCTPAQAAEANAQAYGSSGSAAGTMSVASTADAAPAAGGGWQEQSIAAWRAAVAAGRMTEAEFAEAMDDLKRASGG